MAQHHAPNRRTPHSVPASTAPSAWARLALVVSLGCAAVHCAPSPTCAATAPKSQAQAAAISSAPAPSVGSSVTAAPKTKFDSTAPNLNAEDRQSLVALQVQLDALLEDSMAFWLRHGPDPLTGGYHGALDRFGSPVPGAPRGLVQQSRHLWSLSAYYRHRPNAPSVRREQVKEQASKLYRYLIQTFYDSKDKEFFFRVDSEGKVRDKNKPLYGESFAIYALAEYAAAFNSKDAERYALDCFHSIDKRSHDVKFKGYDQTGTSTWLGSGAAKDTNTHIHLMEAFTQLYVLTKNETVRARVVELLEVVEGRLMQPANYTFAEFAADFTPFGKPYVSYGHDIETAWLLFQTLDALGDPSEKAREKAYALGAHAADWGFDAASGGFFEEGEVDGKPTRIEKIWWVQAEAIAGLLRLYQYRPTRKFLSMLLATTEWVQRYQRDPNEGEWYWGVLADGRLGSHRDAKSEEWKSSYHVVRSLLFTGDWLTSTLTLPRAK